MRQAVGRGFEWAAGGRASTQLQDVHEAFVARVRSPDFSCLGARAALQAANYRLGLYGELGSGAAARRLAGDLEDFVQLRPTWDSPYTTFIACFEQPLQLDEAGFEAALWRQLERLHEVDRRPWDPAVSADPEDPRYSFSFASTAFFVVGLHAAASRTTRRFAWPTLVFNAHEQFERIRETGKFAGIQRAIQARELDLQGSLNPNLGEFGTTPENRQYSGRLVDAAWRCPMRGSDRG